MRSSKSVAVVCAIAALSVLSVVAIGASARSLSGSARESQPALKGRIVVWDTQYTDPSLKPALKQLDSNFMKQHPGVSIQHIGQPTQNYTQLVLAANAAHSGPDVLQNGGGMPYQQFENALTRLNKYIKPNVRKHIVGWEQGARNINPRGAIFGVPVEGASTFVFYYNRDLFTKAGLNPNKPPTTYPRLVAAANALKRAGITPIAGGNAEGYMSEWWLSLLWNSVGSPKQAVAVGVGKTPITSARPTLAMQRYLNFIHTGDFGAGFESRGLGDAIGEFAQGKAGMFGAVFVPGFYNTFLSSLGTKLGVWEPAGVTPTDCGIVYGIPSYAKNKPLDWAYLQYITSSSAAKVRYGVAKEVPSRADFVLPSSAPAVVKTVYKAWRRSSFLGAVCAWQLPIVETFRTQMQSTIIGQQPLSKALAATEAEKKKLLGHP